VQVTNFDFVASDDGEDNVISVYGDGYVNDT
jgi:hypothetical protein